MSMVSLEDINNQVIVETVLGISNISTKLPLACEIGNRPSRYSFQVCEF